MPCWSPWQDRRPPPRGVGDGHPCDQRGHPLVGWQPPGRGSRGPRRRLRVHPASLGPLGADRQRHRAGGDGGGPQHPGGDRTIQPLLPTPPPRYGGRPRVDDRAALAGIVYQLRTGVPWRLLPTRQLGCGSRSPAGGGCATGSAPASGSTSTTNCWTSSAAKAGSTGPGPAWTR
jgi:hypothetical protein